MNQVRDGVAEDAEWFFFSGGPGAPRYGDDPTKHAVDHDTESFVREVLQNANDQGLPNDDPVEVTFRFRTLTGDDKTAFLEALGWTDELEPRLRALAAADDGRGYKRLLDRLDAGGDLRLLVVEDRNTTGITGEWDEDSNYAALVRDELYSSKEDDTAGGSYGLGKSVLWTFSGASTVVFNSHLNGKVGSVESPRLIARTKLPTHELPERQTTYQGAGWLCRPRLTDDGPRPESLWGSDAESFAERLHVSRPDVSGTSAMVVDYRDPTLDERPDIDDLAQEFVGAAVKYFWPAIYRGDLEVTVETPGETHKATVDSVPAIRPFVQCYDRRFDEGSLDHPGDVAGLDIPIEIPQRADGSETPDGNVRLAVRLASPADDDSQLNKVALFRGAGMVVKYYDQNRVAFGDRNFHAVLASGEARSNTSSSDSDKEVDRFLRFAEPPEHDEWVSTENLRDQYQRGFRTALEEMFGTMRDGLRHLLAKSSGEAGVLAENVLNRFPIHGDGSPRTNGSTVQDSVFEIQMTSGFDGQRFRFSGRIAPTVEDFEGWTADVSLTGVGEDGARYDDISIDSLTVEDERISTVQENGTVRLIADDISDTVKFEGASQDHEEGDLLRGDVGETRLEVRAELLSNEEGGDA